MKVILKDIQNIETEALIVGFYEDVRPLKGLAGKLDWLLCGSLSDLVLNNKLSGSLGEVALLASRGKVPADKIFMVGLGPRSGSTPASLRNAAKIAASSAVGAGVTTAVIEYFPLPNANSDAVVSALRDGLSDGAGGSSLKASLLAPDAATYERMSRSVKA